MDLVGKQPVTDTGTGLPCTLSRETLLAARKALANRIVLLLNTRLGEVTPLFDATAWEVSVDPATPTKVNLMFKAGPAAGQDAAKTLVAFFTQQPAYNEWTAAVRERKRQVCVCP